MATVLGILLVVVVLLSTPRVPLEFTAVAAVTLLAATGALPAPDAFSGFVDPAVLFIFSLLAMAQGLMSAGVARPLGRLMELAAGRGERTFLVVTMVIVAAFSSVVSNTATTAAFLPIASATARRVGLSVGRILLPLAYASMIGGTLFLPGTSTNVIVSSALRSWGHPPLGFAELTPLSLPVAVLALAAISVLAPWLLRGEPPEEVRFFRADAAVEEGSPFVGGPVSEIGRTTGVTVLATVSNGRLSPGAPHRRLLPGDRVIVEGTRERLAALESSPGVRLRTTDTLEDGPVRIVEASVPPGSSLEGRSMRELLFSERFGLVALAVHRGPALAAGRGWPLARAVEELAHEPLAAGDVLLLRGPVERVQQLAEERALLVLDDVEVTPVRAGRTLAAAAIFAASLVVGGKDWLPLPVAGMAGLVAMVATGLVPMRRALRVDWRVLALIGAMIAVGRAVERSGLADAVGHLAVQAASGGGPLAVMFALMVATVVLSAPMSNQAAALVMLPVALSAAVELGVEPRPFAIAITLAASFSFVTPLEPSCVMVFRPGRYTFWDFLRMGLPITALLLLLLAFGIPEVWPL